MNHSHLSAQTPIYYTPRIMREEYVATPGAPGAKLATPDYFFDDSATPSYAHRQDSGQASPPYFCESPRIHESDEALPQGAPDADHEMADSGPFGCETPGAYEQEQLEAVADVAAGTNNHPAEDLRDSRVDIPLQEEEPKDVSNLKPIVLKTFQVKKKKKSKVTDPEADITCTVEVITWSWFMNLPLEVRNRIYGYYFFPEGKDWAPRPNFRGKSKWRVKIPALLQSDPYIRKEAISIYYSELKVSGKTATDLVPWLKSIDPKARGALSDITIQYDDKDADNLPDAVVRTRFTDRCCKTLEQADVRVKRAAFTRM